MTPSGRRDLVRDAHRERAHRRHALGAEQLLVALALHLGDRELALQLELLSLPAQRHPAEREHQARGDEHAETSRHMARFSRSRSRAADATATTPQWPRSPASTRASPAMEVRAGSPICAASGRVESQRRHRRGRARRAETGEMSTPPSTEWNAVSFGGADEQHELARARESLVAIDEVSGAHAQIDDSTVREWDREHESRRVRATSFAARSADRTTTGRVAIADCPGPCSPTSDSLALDGRQVRPQVPATLQARIDCSLSRSCSAASASRCSSHHASPVTTAMATTIHATSDPCRFDGTAGGGG